MRRLITIYSCGIPGLCQQSLPVPELNNTYEMVRIIGMNILFTKFDLYFKFFTFFNLVLAKDMRHMSVEIISFYLFVFLSLVLFAVYFPKYPQWEEWVNSTG